MIWIVVILVFVAITVSIYKGALSPFARLQKAASKHWNEAISYFVRNDGWSISCEETQIPRSKNEVWKIIDGLGNRMFVQYNGKDEESSAMKEAERILLSPQATLAILGKIEKPTKGSVLYLVSRGIHGESPTWGGLEKTDEPAFVLSRLIWLGIINESEAFRLWEDYKKSKSAICVFPKCFNDTESILFWFKEERLTSIQIRFKTKEPFGVFYETINQIIPLLGVPSSKSKRTDYFSIRWDTLSLSASNGSGVLINDRPHLYLVVDFVKHKGLDVQKIISESISRLQEKKKDIKDNPTSLRTEEQYADLVRRMKELFKNEDENEKGFE